MNRKSVLISVIIFTILIVAAIILLNRSVKYEKLIISQSQWNSIIESRDENKDLIIEEIKFNDYSLIVDKNNDTIYYSLVNDSNNKYNPSVSYDTNGKNSKLVILSEMITEEKVKSNYQFKIMIYDDNSYHIYYLKCTDLPLLNISFNQDQDINQNNIPMEMYLFDNLSLIPQKIVISSGKIKRVEEGYVISLYKLTPGKNKRDNNISILNMKPSSIYSILKINRINEEERGNANFNDGSRCIELFLNSEYQGLYKIEGIEDNLPQKY